MPFGFLSYPSKTPAVLCMSQVPPTSYGSCTSSNPGVPARAPKSAVRVGPLDGQRLAPACHFCFGRGGCDHFLTTRPLEIGCCCVFFSHARGGFGVRWCLVLPSGFSFVLFRTRATGGLGKLTRCFESLNVQSQVWQLHRCLLKQWC